jgi:hypothetical protein
MCKVTALFRLVLTFEKLSIVLFLSDLMFSVRNELWVNVQVAMFVSTVNRIEGLK